MEELIIGSIGILAAIPAAYFTAKARVGAALEARLNAISGGAVTSIEEVVAAASREKRLRKELIAVYGPERLWSALRKAGHEGAQIVHEVVPGRPGIDGARIAVVDPEWVGEEAMSGIAESVVVVYKEGAPYRGPLPPSESTFANSLLTLSARTREAAQYLGA